MTVNKFAEDFINQKFSQWFSRQINIRLENRQELDDIEVDYRLSVLKPLHANWLISLYNHMSSPEGKETILSGWKKSGIFDAIHLGLPPLDSWWFMPTYGSSTQFKLALFRKSLIASETMMKIIVTRIILNRNRMVTYQTTMVTKMIYAIMRLM